MELASEFSTQDSLRNLRINSYLEQNADINKKIKLDDNTTAVLHDVVNGHPQYKSVHNLQARFTTGVEYVQSVEGLNLNLEGDGLTIGIWDGGLILNSHQEFNKRIVNKRGSELSNHATHVAGTVGALGVRSNAKGMLPKVELLGYYAFDDDLGPMAEEAANGLILSNHSYGLILGWRYNGNAWQWYGQDGPKDLRFGSYTNNSRSIDNIAFNAPFYTIVWSAGNDRSDVGDGTRPPDGPFNIIGPAATSKNIITVGAITGFEEYKDPTSAVMSSFSCWGPTNDGRIKPDLVADGVGVVSASSSGDDQYSTLSGTSMSAPNVTGTLGLIQEFYKQSADTFMTAAQLKSLAIHTTREAGPFDGPDYKFGWGILNAIDAVKLLQGRNNLDTLITQASLNNGEVHEYEIIPDYKTKLTATVVWTDVPGPVKELGSTTPDLVNDLDIHLEDEVGNKYYPWKMNPDNFGGSAQKGINSLDNVEKLEFIPENVRKYKLVVSHKGELVNSSQKYALTLTYGSSHINNDLVYWVNGEGDFQSGLNFSSTSGGNSEPIDLSSITSLIIDENSFPANGNLFLSQDLTLDNIIFTSHNLLNIDLGGNTLSVNNAIHSIGENLKISNGKLIIKPNHDNDIYLNFDGSDNLTVELNNEGVFNISSDIKVSEINILSGEYLIKNKSISLSGLNLFENAEIKLENNEIEFSGLFFNYSENTNLINNNWLLTDAIITSDVPLSSNDIFEINGDNSFNGEFYFKKLINNSRLDVFNKLELDSLILNNFSDVIINNQDSLIINNGVKLNGEENKQILGSNSNQLANMVFTFRSKLCLENIIFDNINFISQSVLNVTSGGSTTNSVNIFELPCEDLIFPDFTISSNCAKSLIYLNNSSEGNIDEYNWEFGGNGFAMEGQNKVKNPTIWLEEVGEYEIILTVSNDLQYSEFSRIIQITENTLSPIDIIENGEDLVASLPASNFQWFKDGLLLEGETGRFLSTEIESGIYNVAYFSSSEEGCQSRVSDSFEYFVTSNKSRIDEEVMLYPNPVNNILTVKNFENYEKIRIFDFQGKMVHSESINAVSHVIELDVSNFNSGLYYIDLAGKNKSIKLKIIIE
jgi:subtilisin family serine protease